RLAKKEIKLMDMIIGEADMPAFYYDIHNIAKSKKTTVPKFDTISKALKKKGYEMSRTHFSETCIKTDAPREQVEKLIK
ncbi:MAG: DUF2067 family protein, partial [Candidatus Aenigmarchaeota archaeon]|nr:DUF2067 family protein [Candidatus Aenigmarchaeota archaeon]